MFNNAEIKQGDSCDAPKPFILALAIAVVGGFHTATTTTTTNTQAQNYASAEWLISLFDMCDCALHAAFYAVYKCTQTTPRAYPHGWCVLKTHPHSHTNKHFRSASNAKGKEKAKKTGRSRSSSIYTCLFWTLISIRNQLGAPQPEVTTTTPQKWCLTHNHRSRQILRLS